MRNVNTGEYNMPTKKDYIEALHDQIDRVWSLIRTLEPPLNAETYKKMRRAIVIELAALEAIVQEMEEEGY